MSSHGLEHGLSQRKSKKDLKISCRSIQIYCRHASSPREIRFQVQIQKLCCQKNNFHYRDRFVQMSAESPSLQIQIFSPKF